MSTATFRVFPLNQGDPRVAATPGLGAGKIATGQTVYVAMPSGQNGMGVDIQWKDATTAATITWEQTNSPETEVSDSAAGDGSTWAGNATVTALITNPAAAIGSSKFRAKDLPCKRNRLKIVTSAACWFEIYVDPRDI